MNLIKTQVPKKNVIKVMIFNNILKYKYTNIFLCIIPLAVGCFIYVGFRTQSLLMFKWFSILKLNKLVENYRIFICSHFKHMHKFVIYSLPNGLWAFSFLQYVSITTKRYIKNITLTICILIIIGLEIFQYFNLIRGTFCFVDLFTNFIAVIIFLLFHILTIKKGVITTK